MECPQCRSGNPEVARFCFRCGQNLLRPELKRRDSYAAGPNEPVASFSLVSTIMPHGAGTRPSTYRTALMVALAFPVFSAAIGLLSFAIVTAAFAVPVVYIIYIYDVNLWEDEPIGVTVMSFLFSSVMALGFTLLWRETLFSDETSLLASKFAQTPRIKEILVLCFLVPVVAEVLKQVGPLFLASRPMFDDLMDGLTFGVISGVGYAAFETLVVHSSRIFDDPLRTQGANTAIWVSIVITAGLIKPIIYGTATGIACAEFSGLGERYDGFTPRYFRGLAEAIAANVMFQLGLYLFGLLEGTTGSLLGMLWGLIVAGALILRVRAVLHRGLLEAAVEAVARNWVSKHSTRDVGFCPHCELPLIDESLFCISCGNSARAVSKVARSLNESAHAEAAMAGAYVGNEEAAHDASLAAPEDLTGHPGDEGGT